MGTGEELVRAIASRDADGLRGLFADAVDFKGLTPGRLWEAGTPDEAVDIFLGSWFEETDRIDAVDHTDEDVVSDTQRVGYRFAITNPDGPQVVEQQAYFRETDGRIDYLRVVCSGFRPRTD